MELIRTPALAAASLGGTALATVTRVIAGLRPAAKPLHPRGALREGELVRTGVASDVATGVPWLDEEGRDRVLVRLSRSVGLPAAMPDIHGVALRVPVEDGSRHADLLFATTGLGRWTRFLLVPGWTAHRPMTTLLPYRTPVGAVVLAMRTVADGHYELAYARGGGPWHQFGALVLWGSADLDPLISFDPVRHPLPQLELYDWVSRLRAPAYVTARGTRPGS